MNKAIVLIGILFLLMTSVACYVWYQYQLTPYKEQAAETAELVLEIGDMKKADTERDSAVLKAPDPKNQEVNTKIVFDLNEPPKPKVSKPRGDPNIDNSDPLTAVSQTTGDVSPYGLGHYPEVPSDFPFLVEWEFPGSDVTHELMARVAIKLWKQGIESYGITMEAGLVYPNYPNTIYVRWGETTDDAGNPIRYINELGGYPPSCERVVSNNIARHGERRVLTAADIPSDVIVKLYSVDGIEPYTFLDLPK